MMIAVERQIMAKERRTRRGESTKAVDIVVGTAIAHKTTTTSTSMEGRRATVDRTSK